MELKKFPVALPGYMVDGIIPPSAWEVEKMKSDTYHQIMNGEFFEIFARGFKIKLKCGLR